jgi:hypothetical protein
MTTELAKTVKPHGDERLTRAVLRVGDGRGFVVSRKNHLGHAEKIIITAAHCLPRLPPPYEHLLQLPTPHPARYLEEETYPRLLSPLGIEPVVWASCLFVDPVADIAVLGQPDNQALSDEADAYDQLIDNMEPMMVADAPAQGFEVVEAGVITIGGVMHDLGKIKRPTAGEGPARVLSLDGCWRDGRIERRGNRLSFEPAKLFVSGMSGSPIVAVDGAAIGVVSVDILSPVLIDSLPTWLVRAIRRAQSGNRKRMGVVPHMLPTEQSGEQ